MQSRRAVRSTHFPMSNKMCSAPFSSRLNPTAFLPVDNVFYGRTCQRNTYDLSRREYYIIHWRARVSLARIQIPAQSFSRQKPRGRVFAFRNFDCPLRDKKMIYVRGVLYDSSREFPPGRINERRWRDRRYCGKKFPGC